MLVASRNHRDQRLEQLLEALQLGDTKAIGSVGGKVATILMDRGEVRNALNPQLIADLATAFSDVHTTMKLAPEPPDLSDSLTT